MASRFDIALLWRAGTRNNDWLFAMVPQRIGRRWYRLPYGRGSVASRLG